VGGTIATQALRDATRTIPIVFVGLSDPVATGIVSSLARPEGNVTGFMNYEHSIAGKWVSLLKDMAPRITRVAVLFHPEATWARFYVRTAQDAGDRLCLKVTAAVVPDVAAIEPAIAAMSGDGGLAVHPDGFNITNRATTIGLAARYGVPAIYAGRYNVVDGGLMSYGAEILAVFRDGATYVDRILASLSRPGANVTGSAGLAAELAPKQLQLLHELIPNAARFGILADPAAPPTQSTIADLQAAARTLGLQLVVVNARTDSNLEMAFVTFSQQRVGAVLVAVGSTFFNRRTEQLPALTARHALPAIFPLREYTLNGGLMSYGSSLHYVSHQAGIYTGRILKGEKPADLPVEQATKLELVINLKTAKALGLTIPETLLATADEVIQ
jgi:ABC-type uncharacterized transport system substrate-binding protein